jgi:hypothetical protein
MGISLAENEDSHREETVEHAHERCKDAKRQHCLLLKIHLSSMRSREDAALLPWNHPLFRSIRVWAVLRC